MKTTFVLLLSFATMVIAACSHDKPAEGPAEQAGQKVDNAADDAKDSARKAGDKIDEATDEAGRKYKEETTSDSGAADDRIK